MAFSNSYDFTLTRDQIVRTALLKIGAIDASEDTIDQEDKDIANTTLNLILKHWLNHEIHLWAKKHTVVILEPDKQSYSLGPTGDHFVLDSALARTTLSADAASGASSITVTSITGMANADTLLIQLDDNTWESETINGAPSGSTVNLTSTLASAASSGNRVFSYASKAQRPERILEAQRRSTSNTETPVKILHYQDYWQFTDKFTAGVVNHCAYDARLTNGELYVWAPQELPGETLEVLAEYPLQDLDAATDNIDVPVAGYMALMYELAENLIPDYHVDNDTASRVRRLRTRYFDEFLDADMERGTIQIVPDSREV